MYVGSAYWNQEAGADTAAQVGAVVGISVVRALLSVPGHVLFSAMWGYALGVAKFLQDQNRAKTIIRTGLVLSMILHGIFNFMLSFPLAVVFIFVFMIYAWKMVNKRITTALLNSPHAHPIPKFQNLDGED